MSGAVRAIHLPGAAALESVRQRAQAAFDSWAQEWVSAPMAEDGRAPVLQVGMDLEAVRATASEYEVLHNENSCIWFRQTDGDRLNFARAVASSELMLGVTCVDRWVDEAVERARTARNRALREALFGGPIATSTKMAALPSELFAFGSGAIHLSCESLGLFAIADGAVWRSVPPSGRTATGRRPALTPLERTVRRARARLDVILGSVEVELPTLLGAKCGDVLRLPQRLDQGITVLCEGKPLAYALLAEKQGLKCVQLIARHS